MFTHHADGVERQSLAFSTDHGMSWRKYDDNPVLESTERDFRDPKVRRHVSDGRAEWVMVLAVGRRIDFYTAQSFSGTPGDTTVQMAWLDSWRYAQTHPSSGRRGVLSFPRRIEVQVVGGQEVVTARPAVDLASRAVPIAGTTWASGPGRALHIEATGDVDVVIRVAADGPAQLTLL